jgi:hypothetical protein
MRLITAPFRLVFWLVKTVLKIPLLLVKYVLTLLWVVPKALLRVVWFVPKTAAKSLGFMGLVGLAAGIGVGFLVGAKRAANAA